MPDGLERRLCEEEGFNDKFLEGKNRREERKLMEDVSLEDEISVQNYEAQISEDFRNAVEFLIDLFS